MQTTTELAKPSMMKKCVLFCFVATLAFFITLDSFIFRIFVPHIPKFVSNTIDNIRGPGKLDAPLYDQIDLPLNDTLDKDTLRQRLKKLGYEPAEDHQFKSPYIITPKIYPQRYITPPANKTRKTKVISCFNCPSWFYKSNLNAHNRDFKSCPYRECQFDYKGKKRSTADVVLFFVGQIGSKPKPKRPPGQIWVKCYWESPVHYRYPKNYTPWKNAFNWTFNYRMDSDIFGPNNLLAWRDRENLLSDEEYLNIAKKKTRTAAWWVSHCNSQSGRDKFVKELQKHIDVDVYGKCGPLKCSKTNLDKCEQMLTTTYKFYLSLENSICRDYVTEKFFRNFAYRSHIVPVVRGGWDYNKYIPNDAFVNAAHFKKAKDLAMYLKKLGSDHETYAKMLKEKDKLVTLNQKFDWCDICEKIHTNKETKMIPDIKKWSHEGTCHKPNDIS